MQVDVPHGRVGIVVIGRNEGERLSICLRSLQSHPLPVVYVDSGSADGSVELARPQVGRVVQLDPARPFSAARARNEGFSALREVHPKLDFVQFIDGDCTLANGWIEAASAALDADPCKAIVIGRLEERLARESVYNRLCSLEWRSPPGDVTSFGALGGIMFVRASVFTMLNGFNAEVIAGEDSEFGVRVGGAGFKVTKLDAPMATHDADIRRFGQWWKRAVRSGHAIGQRSYLNGRSAARDCMRERRSIVAWGLMLPAAVLLLALPTRGLALLVLAAGYGLLGMRVFRFRRRQGDSRADARLYASFNVMGKLAEGIGLLKFYWNRALGRFRIIEYK
jgi:glycosyltransferase involved in cell wall biosynthesis